MADRFVNIRSAFKAGADYHNVVSMTLIHRIRTIQYWRGYYAVALGINMRTHHDSGA